MHGLGGTVSGQQVHPAGIPNLPPGQRHAAQQQIVASREGKGLIQFYRHTHLKFLPAALERCAFRVPLSPGSKVNRVFMSLCRHDVLKTPPV
jgi:hypothetical protein